MTQIKAVTNAATAFSVAVLVTPLENFFFIDLYCFVYSKYFYFSIIRRNDKAQTRVMYGNMLAKKVPIRLDDMYGIECFFRSIYLKAQ